MCYRLQQVLKSSEGTKKHLDGFFLVHNVIKFIFVDFFIFYCIVLLILFLSGNFYRTDPFHLAHSSVYHVLLSNDSATILLQRH